MLRFSFLISSTILKRSCSSISSLNVKQILLKPPINQKILVKGWVQAIRKYKDLCFVDLIDNTGLNRLQVVIPDENSEKSDKNIPTFQSAIEVEGSLVKSSYPGQEVELIANSWKTLGPCDEDYPFVNHLKYTTEYVRQQAHLRAKTRRYSSILRIRNHAFMAVHNFFQNEDYCYITPTVITQNDCEGAGEVFSVEPAHKGEGLLSDKKEDVNISKITSGSEKDGVTDVSEKALHFFGDPAYLTVSGQFHLEAMTNSFRAVYTVGPTFRAERSRTKLHSCEFQMIEAEIAFIDRLEDLCKVVENCIKSIFNSIMEKHAEDVHLVTQDIKNHESYIKDLLLKPFIQMSYEELIDVLQKSKDPIKYGEDMNAKHKDFLIKYCNNTPVFVKTFPSAIKPFYMKSDGEKAHCFDLFAAYGGEICGGSLREENYEKLKVKHPFDKNKSVQWYLDLRKYGCPPHGGFGIGFDRLLQSLLGISNIRDLIPFPRRKNDCKC